MRKLLQPFRELGALPGFFYLLDRASERLFHRRIFYYYSIVAQPVVAPRLRPGKGQVVTVCSEWHEIEPFANRMTATEQMTRDRFSRGYICVVLARERDVLGYGWLAMNGYVEDEVRCDFAPSPAQTTGWDFDVDVLPEHRGTLTFARLWDAINAALAQNGRSWSVSRISRFNATSFQSHKSMGAVRCVDVLFMVLGRLQLLIAPVAPYFDVSLSQDSRPVLEVEISRCIESDAS
jgi:hypothetical protein